MYYRILKNYYSMNKYQDKLNGFAERMKTEEIKTPVQEVKPVFKGNKKLLEQEIQLNVWITKSLMRKIKQKSLDSEMSIKDWVIESIKLYLSK